MLIGQSSVNDPINWTIKLINTLTCLIQLLFIEFDTPENFSVEIKINCHD